MKKLSGSLTGKGISIQQLKDEFDLNEKDLSELVELFEQLQSSGFIFSETFVNEALGGSFMLLGFNDILPSTFKDNGRFKRERPKVAILHTNPNLEENFQWAQYQRWMDITIIDAISNPDLFEFDSANSTEATDVLNFLKNYQNFSEFEAFLVILDFPHPTLLRNLNRIFINYKMPWILSTLDGPFVIITTFVPEHSACFECFEIRILSQMRSLQEYRSFVSLLSNKIPLSRKVEFNPVLQMPFSIAMNELIMLSSFKANHFVGRLLSIYLPFFEIQMQDLLRIPVCPACGYTSKATMNELYFDFRKFIAGVTDKLNQ
jgi:thiazole/oxazole-forming peptide maturase SagC family component